MYNCLAPSWILGLTMFVAEKPRVSHTPQLSDKNKMPATERVRQGGREEAVSQTLVTSRVNS